MTKQRIAIFASGSGSNAENIALYLQNHETLEVALILSNNADAFVLERARKLGIPSQVFSREEFKDPQGLVQDLKVKGMDFLVLAGFLWLVPPHFVTAYPDRIVNIHPALLPKYGGKGMYGNHVHEAVVAAQEKESGITIHLVNERYDEGAPLFQAKCEVLPDDTPHDVAQKVHALEYAHFPKVIEGWIASFSSESSA